jgi:hypothetical protein
MMCNSGKHFRGPGKIFSVAAGTPYQNPVPTPQVITAQRKG